MTATILTAALFCATTVAAYLWLCVWVARQAIESLQITNRILREQRDAALEASVCAAQVRGVEWVVGNHE